MSTPATVFVAPGGAFGTAMALMAQRAGNNVTLYFGKEDDYRFATENRQSRRLPGHLLSKIKITSSFKQVGDASLVILAPRAQHARALIKEVFPKMKQGAILVMCTKGIERKTGSLMTDIIDNQCDPDFTEERCAFLSGPSFAEQLANCMYTCVTVASFHKSVAEHIQARLSSKTLRVYTSTDVTGVTLCGVCKNAIAIAAGIIAGMGFGTNTSAALFTRSMAEITRFVLSQGGHRETLYGLAGIGDLMLTCNSTESRNFSFGHCIGSDHHPDIRQFLESFENTTGVVEGFHVIPRILELAQLETVEMPIMEMLGAVLFKGMRPKQAIETLMDRPLRSEDISVIE